MTTTRNDMTAKAGGKQTPPGAQKNRRRIIRIFAGPLGL